MEFGEYNAIDLGLSKDEETALALIFGRNTGLFPDPVYLFILTIESI